MTWLYAGRGVGDGGSIGAVSREAWMSDPTEVAGEVLRWHVERRRFESFAAQFGIGDVSAAYNVQDVVVRRRSEDSGARPVGYKIGLTSPRMQQMCGVDFPLSGVVLDNLV